MSRLVHSRPDAQLGDESTRATVEAAAIQSEQEEVGEHECGHAGGDILPQRVISPRNRPRKRFSNARLKEHKQLVMFIKPPLDEFISALCRWFARLKHAFVYNITLL